MEITAERLILELHVGFHRPCDVGESSDDVTESPNESRLLAEEVYARSDSFARRDVQCEDFDLGVAERHPGLDLPRPCRRGRRSLLVGGGGGVRGLQLEA